MFANLPRDYEGIAPCWSCSVGPCSSQMGRITFDDAVQAVEDDYAMNRRSTLDDVQRQVRLHLKPYFGGWRMTNITTDVITA